MKTIYRRNLPHIQPAGGQFFVTFRLKDSIPADRLQAYFAERDSRLRACENDSEKLYKEEKRFFARFDAYLDRCLTKYDYLRQPVVAELLASVIQQHNQGAYDLLAYCIMPNHVHLVLDLAIQQQKINTDDYRALHQIIGSMKSYSAKRINELLNRTGPLWQRESYDHLIRSPDELMRIIRYVLTNPVKAELVAHWYDWPHSYIAPELESSFI